MSTDATLTSKGQTTIPKEIRENLQMKAGDRMTFTLLPNGDVPGAGQEQIRNGCRGAPAQAGAEGAAGRRTFSLMIALDTAVEGD